VRLPLDSFHLIGLDWSEGKSLGLAGWVGKQIRKRIDCHKVPVAGTDSHNDVAVGAELVDSLADSMVVVPGWPVPREQLAHQGLISCASGMLLSLQLEDDVLQ
jgi:hypothetical protein